MISLDLMSRYNNVPKAGGMSGRCLAHVLHIICQSDPCMSAKDERLVSSWVLEHARANDWTD